MEREGDRQREESGVAEAVAVRRRRVVELSNVASHSPLLCVRSLWGASVCARPRAADNYAGRGPTSSVAACSTRAASSQYR